MLKSIILIDVSNIYFGKRIDYERLMKKLRKDRDVIKTIAYVVSKLEDTQSQGFFNRLKSLGLEVKNRYARIFHNGKVKSDWDVGIAVDALNLENACDEITLVTGDGDFIPLVEELHRRRIRVRLCCFLNRTAFDLRRIVDEFVEIREDLYLRRKK